MRNPARIMIVDSRSRCFTNHTGFDETVKMSPKEHSLCADAACELAVLSVPPSVDWLDEYFELLRGAGLVEFGHVAQIELIGPDAVSLVNRLCTNRVDELAAGDGCEAFFTDPKGHVVDYSLVFRTANSLVLHSFGPAATILAHLDRYIIRDRVDVHDRSRWSEFLLSGKRSPKVLAQWPAMVPAERPLAHVAFDCAGITGSVRRIEFGGPAMFLVSVPSQAAEDARKHLEKAGARACNPAAAEAIRVEMGWPKAGLDISVENLPQEVGRDRWAISYTKGCYLGQETVARIESRGHVNKRLVGLRFADARIPPSGMELTREGTLVGRVTSATYSPCLGASLALGYVARRSAEVATRLDSPLGPVEVITPPLMQTG